MCDDCGEFFSESRGGWVLDRIGLSVTSFGDLEPPFHFCSLKCLMAWAEAR